jgi:CyaY protein
MMDETTYATSVKQVFGRLLKAVDGADPDLIEADSTPDMVTISSAKTSEKVIVNTQRAVRQIWVAGKGLGVHFSLGGDGRWLDDRGQGKELVGWVRECVEAATGVKLEVG